MGCDPAAQGCDCGRLIENKVRQSVKPLLPLKLIFIMFRHTPGHEHPNFRVAFNNYSWLLQSMGMEQAEIKSLAFVIQNILRHSDPKMTSRYVERATQTSVIDVSEYLWRW